MPALWAFSRTHICFSLSKRLIRDENSVVNFEVDCCYYLKVNHIYFICGVYIWQFSFLFRLFVYSGSFISVSYFESPRTVMTTTTRWRPCQAQFPISWMDFECEIVSRQRITHNVFRHKSGFFSFPYMSIEWKKFHAFRS